MGETKARPKPGLSLRPPSAKWPHFFCGWTLVEELVPEEDELLLDDVLLEVEEVLELVPVAPLGFVCPSPSRPGRPVKVKPTPRVGPLLSSPDFGMFPSLEFSDLGSSFLLTPQPSPLGASGPASEPPSSPPSSPMIFLSILIWGPEYPLPPSSFSDRTVLSAGSSSGRFETLA